MNTDLCEVKTVSFGPEQTGQGVFARKTISKNTLVLSEDLFWVNSTASLEGKAAEYFTIGNSIPQTEISVKDDSAATLAYYLWKDNTPLDGPLLGNLQTGLKPTSTPIADAHTWMKTNLPTPVPDLETFAKYYIKVVPNYINGTLIVSPSRDFGAGIGAEFSKFNHQCLSNNCTFVLIPGHIFIYTKYTIPQGDELTITYGADKDFIKPDTMSKILGFDCQCRTHTTKPYPYVAPDPFLAQIARWFSMPENQTREKARDITQVHGRKLWPDSPEVDQVFMIMISEMLIDRFQENSTVQIVMENLKWAQLFYVATKRYGHNRLNYIRSCIFLYMAYLTIGFYYNKISEDPVEDHDYEMNMSRVGTIIMSNHIVEKTKEWFPDEPRIMNHWQEMCPALHWYMDPVPITISRFERLVIDPDWKICIVCLKTSTKWCPKCKKTYYCSAECQHADWKLHKQECALLTGE